MILRAPAYVYPVELWAFRPEGSFISKANWVDSDSAKRYVPSLENYQINAAGRRLRWAELLPGDASIKIPRSEEPELAIYTIGENDPALRRIDYRLNSFAGLRKPSFCTFKFTLFKQGSDPWKVYLDSEGNGGEVLTDFVLYPFIGSPRQMYAKECRAYTCKWDSSIGATSGVWTFAVGSWAQLQVYSEGTVGALTRFRIDIVAEKQCRIYAESIDDLSGTPVVSMAGGQSFPVQIKGPSDTDLAASQGGIIINGGNPAVYALLGRSDGAYTTKMVFRADFEVPYDI